MGRGHEILFLLGEVVCRVDLGWWQPSSWAFFYGWETQTLPQLRPEKEPRKSVSAGGLNVGLREQAEKPDLTRISWGGLLCTCLLQTLPNVSSKTVVEVDFQQVWEIAKCLEFVDNYTSAPLRGEFFSSPVCMCCLFSPIVLCGALF